MRRAVFFVSDSTGITAEAIGRGVLVQFEEVEFFERTLPFVDDAAKATAAANDIRAAAEENGERAIVFCTFVDDSLAAIVRESGALTLDCLDAFTPRLEAELKVQSAHRTGRLHSSHGRDYQRRIDALNFTMNHDDGASVKNLARADIILIGVSRSGKTPTSLYLALNYGIFTANYPLVDEDLRSSQLPLPLRPFAKKLHALTISPRRLSELRQQRRPDSRYADLSNCEKEVRAAEVIFRQNNITCLDVTRRSVEELASKILQEANLM
ncbi:MAG: pyruvate, water dikinase regulatory protein [Gammaproteobacteria bacterium]